MNYFYDQPYDITCRDLKHYGIECCETCHEDPENLRIIKVDASDALVCCEFENFFYPPASPEERLLRAIFGEKHERKEKK
jgi:hypothetical protein